jgi:hypothetical protein
VAGISFSGKLITVTTADLIDAWSCFIRSNDRLTPADLFLRDLDYQDNNIPQHPEFEKGVQFTCIAGSCRRRYSAFD